jgi:hypothetical protein
MLMTTTETERKAYALLQANVEGAQALEGLLGVLAVCNEFSRTVSDTCLGSVASEAPQLQNRTAAAEAYVKVGAKTRRKQLAALKPSVPLVKVKGKPSANEMREYNALVAVKRSVAKTSRLRK